MFMVLVSEHTFDHKDGLPKGVTITMKPVDEDAEAMARDVFDALAFRDGEIVDWEHEDTQSALRAYDVALLAACVVNWTGIGDHTGKNALPLTIEGTRAVMFQRQIHPVLFKAFLEPYYLRIAEKKRSSPSLNGTSVAAVSKTSNSPDPKKPG